MKDFSERTSALAEGLVGELEPKLQSALLDADWDYPVDLQAKDGTISLTYKRNDVSGLFDAEYGPEGGAPTAVIRPFLREAEPVIKAALEDDLLNYLFEEGILP